jgi:hypothetical protein
LLIAAATAAGSRARVVSSAIVLAFALVDGP